MQIGAINGTSFRGLIYSPSRKVYINTDAISKMSPFYHDTRTSLYLKNGENECVNIEEPIDCVINAYKKAAEAPQKVVKIESQNLVLI